MIRVEFDERCSAWKLVWIILSFLMLCFLMSCSQEEKVRIKVGDKAPAFIIKDIDGKSFSLSEYLGSPVVLRFFLTDCKFCRADTPVFNEYYARFHSKGLRIIYIDTLGIDDQALNSFRRKLAISFPIAADRGGKVAAAYMVKALPQTIVLDPQHKIIAAILGGVSEPELKRLLLPYLFFD